MIQDRVFVNTVGNDGPAFDGVLVRDMTADQLLRAIRLVLDLQEALRRRAPQAGIELQASIDAGRATMAEGLTYRTP